MTIELLNKTIEHVNDKFYEAYWLPLTKTSKESTFHLYMTTIDRAIREALVTAEKPKYRAVHAHPDAKGKTCQECSRKIHKGNAVSFQTPKGVEKPKYYHVLCIKKL